METVPHHPGMAQFQGQDIDTFLLDQLEQRGLVAVDDDEIGADAA
jgi:hypothetical protein